MKLEDALSRALGANVRELRAIGGGDINDAFRVALDDGRACFVKTNDRALPDMFVLEAEGLAWLAEAGAVRVPRVLAASESFLALELIEPGRKANDFADQLGRGLAALHRSGADGFGWREDNFIATLPQENAREPDWPRFYVHRRLEPQLARAVDRGLIGRALQKTFERLFARMSELAGPTEPPARLHGDLWGGNCIADERGAPVLIDPAVYGGHREIDLAMMKLFGGFSERVFAAYHEAYPLAEGWEDRVPLYQLYPLLVHVNLFGGGYVSSLESALARIG